MSKSHMPAIRALLRTEPDGLTLVEISGRIAVPVEIIRNCMARMPDAYIDRWQTTEKGPYAAVWCVVVPPPNCPHPTRKTNRSKT